MIVDSDLSEDAGVKGKTVDAGKNLNMIKSLKGISTFDTRIDSWKSGHWFLSFNCCVRWCNQGQYQVGKQELSLQCSFQYVHGWKPVVLGSLHFSAFYGEYYNQMTFFSCLMNWCDWWLCIVWVGWIGLEALVIFFFFLDLWWVPM